MSFLLFIYHRNHDTLQRLAYLDIHFAAQCQYHRCNILCHLHAGFQFLVYHFFLIFREFGKMDRNYIVASCCCNQVSIQPVCIERRYRSHQFGNCFETSVQCLISRQFILCKFTTPETFTIQANIPVGQIIIHKIRNQTSCLCRFIFIIACIYLLY